MILDARNPQGRPRADAAGRWRTGSGNRLRWGGFAEQAAAEGRDVTGITISRNQQSYAECRLDGRADIQLRDYRDIAGRYDNIVSIEMIEAVGARYWPSYFAVLTATSPKVGARCCR